MRPDRKVRDPASEVLPRGVTQGPRSVDGAAPPHASPARHLQDLLAESLAGEVDDEPRRWPGAVRLAVIVGGSGAVWAGIACLFRIALLG